MTVIPTIVVAIHNTYWRMTSSSGNIFRVTGPLWGDATCEQWIPLTKASDAELCCLFYLCMNKRLGKQSRCRWIGMPSRSSWRHCNGIFWYNCVTSGSNIWVITCPGSGLLHVRYQAITWTNADLQSVFSACGAMTHLNLWQATAVIKTPITLRDPWKLLRENRCSSCWVNDPRDVI